MSAADHVSPQQWITIHHMSDHPDPPHILGREKVNGYSNAIPEALHMGTDKTVESHFCPTGRTSTPIRSPSAMCTQSLSEMKQNS